MQSEGMIQPVEEPVHLLGYSGPPSAAPPAMIDRTAKGRSHAGERPHVTSSDSDGPLVVYWTYGPAGSEQRWLSQ